MLDEIIRKGGVFVSMPFIFDGDTHSVMRLSIDNVRTYYDVSSDSCTPMFSVSDSSVTILSEKMSPKYYKSFRLSLIKSLF